MVDASCEELMQFMKKQKLNVFLGFAQSAALTTWPELKSWLHCAEAHEGQRPDKHTRRHHFYG